MKLKTLAPFALVLVAVSASAEGFYGVGEVTRSKDALNQTHFDDTLTANGATGLSSHENDKSNQWRLQGGYRFNPNLAVEAGYIDFGKTDYKPNYSGGSAKGSLKAGGVDVVGIASLPLNDSFSVFGKAGLVVAKVKSSLAAGAPAGLASGNDSATVVRPLVGVGASYKLTQNVDLRADYDYVNGLGSSGKTGKMNSSMFSLGLAYNF